MSEIKDTRNWKCFVGMHQWKIINKYKDRQHLDGELILSWTVYVLQCVHCGKIKNKPLDGN
ncbi:hypothetical protein [Arsenophonus nasoniae]|uniref:Uncharacterized protein n=1 Tax=Arsenophonus nasoniae TaxID=638 RepID=A0AA95GKY0_9GAMM|nr:hypothetical protein [Arsenophonus nasoniae]WGM00388.1 hypothetical protein QE210_10915 [Arsenophonus nasoniae]